MTWKVTFYSEKVREKTLSFPPGIKAKLLQIVDTIIATNPTALGKPHIAPMGKGLFEIRAKGKEGIGRSFYCTIHEKNLVILHSFIKKMQKTPKKDLDLAIKRMKEIKK